MNDLISENPKSSFVLEHGNADGPRSGTLSLPGGVVPTPVFMPVGTQATVKGVLPRDLYETVRCPIILGNTYHLNLRPGVEVVEAAGGLSKFMNWSGPVLTDSGGFQVFSLSSLRKMTDEGVRFRSHLDGREIFLGPKQAVQIQEGLKSDIAMCFDECPPADATREQMEKAVSRTSLWANMCREEWNLSQGKVEGRNLFGIVQGGRFEDLRIQSADELMEMNFPGYAIGGVSVGETEEEMLQQVSWTAKVLPWEKPRYVMGVGTPPQLLKMIGMGADMFDCVMPSRAARHGMAFTSRGTINLKNQKYQNDYSPLDEETDCFASQQFSKSYLRHLIQAKESLAGVILTLHNLRFFVSLMEQARLKIEQDQFQDWSRAWIAQYEFGQKKAE